jgi:hypothetical protein
MTLMRPQKNQVFEAIREAGFDPGDFFWDEDDVELAHTPSDYYFKFGFAAGTSAVEFTPGENRPIQGAFAPSWQQQLALVPRWLELLRMEWETPDLWAELEREREVLGLAGGPGVENTPFTSEELALISDQIRELKQYVQAQALDEGQLRELEARLDYVEAAAQRGTGRIDWWNQFVGAILNLVLQGIVQAHLVQAILVLAGHALGGLFGGGQPQLPGGDPPPRV